MAKQNGSTTKRTSPKRIGILRGMETSFPEALIAFINEQHGDQGVHASFVSVDAVNMHEAPPYEVILDRISHEVPFYRSYLKFASLCGTTIVNNPFWWSADDKFIDNVIAEQVGVAVPRSVILPHKDHPHNTDERTFRNLAYPLDWQAVFDYIGFPAFLKPFDGGGWRAVTRVTTAEELYKAYDESGTDCMMLQESIEFDEYYRCYGVGRKEVLIMPYNPGAEPHRRYHDVPSGVPTPEMRERLTGDVLKLCKALGYDLNTVEFALRDGIPYAIDFMNPAPDADYNAVGAQNFEWIVTTMADYLVKKARQPRRRRQFNPTRALETA